MNTISELKEKILIGQWIENKGKGYGSAGITLEKMLEKETENFEIPDYKEFELKTKYSTKESNITLFNATPDSFLFQIKRLKEEYGYPDPKQSEFKIFNLSVYGNRKAKLKNHYFKLHVDNLNRKIFLIIYNENLKIIDNLISWSFDMLKEKVERKLQFLAIVHADIKFENNKIYFRYNKIDFYKLISFEQFLKLIETGKIRITFRIGVYKSGKKYGQIYDHGTAFNINEFYITKLFTKI